MSVRIFFVGYSSVGKSPMIEFVKQRADALAIPLHVVYAGGWIAERLGFSGNKDDLTKEQKAEMTEAARKSLLLDPDYPANWMREQSLYHPRVVFDGVRNPRDFASLHRPGDKTVAFSRTPTKESVKGVSPRTSFEAWGVPAVLAYAQFADEFLGSSSHSVCIPSGEVFSQRDIDACARFVLNLPWGT